jgi:hypothetical protein
MFRVGEMGILYSEMWKYCKLVLIMCTMKRKARKQERNSICSVDIRPEFLLLKISMRPRVTTHAFNPSSLGSGVSRIMI